MKRLLLALTAGIVTGCTSLGLSKEESEICRVQAARELNEFSAKQTYNYCVKNIKTNRSNPIRKSNSEDGCDSEEYKKYCQR